ncbi:Chromosome transmission fidelity protein 18 [Tieghemiomyces parasiticus]|uniref:Chromosome transmission fidelity protein 18 n=1 Tax=Tieghemiomyces parasiticus TaxID=78921 RepID=A0A9W8DXP1_9FUNG|nr:Chromosome transmission fidelity protein 18 [Tieghemiomyces parasiticus]
MANPTDDAEDCSQTGRAFPISQYSDTNEATPTNSQKPSFLANRPAKRALPTDADELGDFRPHLAFSYGDDGAEDLDALVRLAEEQDEIEHELEAMCEESMQSGPDTVPAKRARCDTDGIHRPTGGMGSLGTFSESLGGLTVELDDNSSSWRTPHTPSGVRVRTPDEVEPGHEGQGELSLFHEQSTRDFGYRSGVSDNAASSSHRRTRPFSAVVTSAQVINGDADDLQPSSTSHPLETYNYRLPPVAGPFVMASTSHGQRLYFPKKKTPVAPPGQTRQEVMRKLVASLSGVVSKATVTGPSDPASIYRIMDEIDQDRIAAAMRKSGLAAKGDQDMMPDDSDRDGDSKATLAPAAMWVDKHKPRRFTDLVSEEKVNRETLLWLKEWDYCVFGRHKRAPFVMPSKYGRDFKPSGGDRSHPGKASNQAGGHPTVTGSRMELGNFKNTDPHQRPFRKILLLAGPPGLGKTTLAHIIAQQAGYTTVEINASDDRTGTQVYQKLLSITQSHSVRASGKPTALIIDEIDGVVGGNNHNNHNSGRGGDGGGGRDFISLLVAMATAEVRIPKKSSTTLNTTSTTLGGMLGHGGIENDDRTRGRRKPGPPALLRPIICICNNLYAPSLRPLRAVAQVYTLYRPPPASLAQRLSSLCLQEGILTDLSTLVALCERAECDLRNCLHTLQFLRKDLGPGERLTWEMVKRAPVGIKDMQQSLFTLWERIFTPPTARPLAGSHAAATAGGGPTDNGPAFVRRSLTPSSRDATSGDSLKIRGTAYRREYLAKLAADIRACNEHDKLVMGCFENYLRLRFHDAYLTKVVQVGDWLAFYDRLNRGSGGGGGSTMALNGYLSYPLLFFHSALANPFVRNLDFPYPRVDYEVRTRRQARAGILESLLAGVRTPLLRHLWPTPAYIAQELLPWLIRIIATPLRGTNLQLLPPEDRQALQRLVGVMAAFGLTYIQDKAEDGSFTSRIEPPLEDALIPMKLTIESGDWATVGTVSNAKEKSGQPRTSGLPPRAGGTSLLNIPNATKLMIAQEVEKECIRVREVTRAEKEAGALVRQPKPTTAIPTPTDKPAETDQPAAPLAAVTANRRAYLVPQPRPLALKDFFGRPIIVAPPLPTGTPDTGGQQDQGDTVAAPGPTAAINPLDDILVWYEYNEGYSNAVRKPVKVGELIFDRSDNRM